ncbi:hypothetical protein NDU88_006414 [Pleurodeles waltl]|uniref:Uncharacterized protein n=1 Tax=Pleurodeles waltl TaxID=8319 RepID=A0AAV7TWS8_PLEWA|nr:hypothetical protein NDU88_006414 [Pleurodeles waltl]
MNPRVRTACSRYLKNSCSRKRRRIKAGRTQRQTTLTIDYHIFKQHGRASDNQDQSHKNEGEEKNATAAQEGNKEEIGTGEDQGSKTQIGGSTSKADVQEETASLDQGPDAWSEE